MNKLQDLRTHQIQNQQQAVKLNQLWLQCLHMRRETLEQRIREAGGDVSELTRTETEDPSFDIDG
jgi:hypothetical protein